MSSLACSLLLQALERFGAAVRRLRSSTALSVSRPFVPAHGKRPLAVLKTVSNDLESMLLGK